VEIHYELCTIHGQNVMFKDGRTNVHDEEWSGRPSVVSDDLVQSVDKKFVKDGASQFQNLHVNFHKFLALFLWDYHS
jgi:hypothetical protein